MAGNRSNRDSSALRRWMVAGPEVSWILEQLEDSYDGMSADTQHHEETKANQKHFLEHLRQSQIPWRNRELHSWKTLKTLYFWIQNS